MTPATVYLAVRFTDGTSALLTRDEWVKHDWIARPAAFSRLVNADELAELVAVPERIGASVVGPTEVLAVTNYGE